jgi:DNA-binding NarL/FixJ family response regulator
MLPNQETTMSKIRVLIAEDHATVREGLKLILGAQSDIEVVGDTGDGRTAVTLTQQLRPDIVLMDISMPGLNGQKATAQLKECCPDVRVLALTRHQEDGYLQQMLRSGASGYILKQSPRQNFYMRFARWQMGVNTSILLLLEE